jgi:pyruvate formate lyase activating enzyme
VQFPLSRLPELGDRPLAKRGDGHSVSVSGGVRCRGALWFEYTLDAAKHAKALGLCTNYVTNGSITSEAFDLLAEILDVYRVDIKGFSKETYQKIGHLQEFKEILAVTGKAKKCGMHVEVVTNIIPGVNDSEPELRDIARWIKNDLGLETPWHVTRFYPHHKLSHLAPTPLAILENAWSIGKEAGLRYVYLGNVPGHKWENTYCHQCDILLIERYVFDIIQNLVTDSKCPQCGAEISGTF